MVSKYTKNQSDVLDQELQHLQAWWAEKNKSRAAGNRLPDPDRKDLMGLALSGGGIRSGAFAIGVMQTLAKAGILERIHYLSTVSGGGFAGSSLTWFMSQKIPQTGSNMQASPPEQKYGISGERFPFAMKPAPDHGGDGTRQNATPLDFIRQRGSYLEPGAGLNKLSAVAIVARSVSVSVAVYFSLATLIFWALMVSPLLPTDLLTDRNRALSWALVGLVAILILNLLYSFFTAVKIRQKTSYDLRRTTQILFGWAWAAIVALLAIGLIDWVQPHIRTFLRLDDLLSNLTLSGVLGALGAVGGFLARMLAARGGASGRQILPAVVVWGSAILLILGFGISADIAARELIGPDISKWHAPNVFWLALFIVIGLGFGLFANINYTGLHRMYRDRLMEAFLPNPADAVGDTQAPQTAADGALVRTMCALGSDGPYHLINTNVVLVGSQESRYRSRAGDSFVMSPLYCGSRATGWRPTAAWIAPDAEHVPKWVKVFKPLLAPMREMTLPTAMAISGAALNPRTGADGRGPTRSGLLSFVLTLLNLRLGYWAPNPDPSPRPMRRWLPTTWPAYYPPNFIFPGLFKGVLALRHDETDPWVELSDGGHFDNIGLYELVRRRVRRIIVVDGSADPNVDFASFANAYERAFVDFGVRFKISGSQSDFNLLMPGTARPLTPIKERYRLAERGFAIGEIVYPPEEPGGECAKGYVFYIKTTLTEGLPSNLYSYKAAHPDFPDEPTSDQFFDEQQFEAYRSLGKELGVQMVEYARNYQPLSKALDIKPDKSAEESWPVPEQPTDPRVYLQESKLGEIIDVVRGERKEPAPTG